MSEVIIFGVGKTGKKLISELEQKQGISVLGLVDNAAVLQHENYPMMDLKQVKDKQIAVIIAIEKAESVVQVYRQLKRQGFKRIYWYDARFGISRKEFGGLRLLDCRNWGECVLPHIEMHVMDGCNLNCRGCSHFSPLFPKTEPDMQRRLADVKRLKELFSHILIFYILGGEPLLNSRLTVYLHEIRDLLPETRIVLVTNGLLIPQLQESVLECFHDNHIVVNISEYKPVLGKMKEITDRLEEFEIVYEVRPYADKSKFNKPLSLCADSVHNRKCISEGCMNLCEGKIARCPTLMYLNRFNEVFHTDLPEEGIINLSAVHSGDELLDRLKMEVPLCKHCIEYEIPWSRCGKTANLSDFAELD